MWTIILQWVIILGKDNWNQLLLEDSIMKNDWDRFKLRKCFIIHIEKVHKFNNAEKANQLGPLAEVSLLAFHLRASGLTCLWFLAVTIATSQTWIILLLPSSDTARKLDLWFLSGYINTFNPVVDHLNIAFKKIWKWRKKERN